MSTNGYPSSKLDPLRRFDTCTLANAIERFHIRPRNEGFMSRGAFCQFPELPPAVGYAVTGRIQTYMPPVTGKCYHDNVEWWRYVVSIPYPRIIVLEDFDNRPGFGALFGEVHARICKALACVAYVSNGAVRDLEAVEALGIQLFAGNLSVSHAYAHIVDFGGPVEIGGLRIKPGDILHGDRHGILSVPDQLVDKLPMMAEKLQSEERELFAMMASSDFSMERLEEILQHGAERQRCV